MSSKIVKLEQIFYKISFKLPKLSYLLDQLFYKYFSNFQKFAHLKSTELNLSRLVFQQVHLNFQTFWIRLIPD